MDIPPVSHKMILSELVYVFCSAYVPQGRKNRCHLEQRFYRDRKREKGMEILLFVWYTSIKMIKDVVGL
jgi:hypothetical protein